MARVAAGEYRSDRGRRYAKAANIAQADTAPAIVAMPRKIVQDGDTPQVLFGGNYPKAQYQRSAANRLLVPEAYDVSP